MKGTVNSASNDERIPMTECEPIAGWRVSLWFAILSPMLGILVGVLVLFVFGN